MHTHIGRTEANRWFACATKAKLHMIDSLILDFAYRTSYDRGTNHASVQFLLLIWCGYVRATDLRAR